MQIRSGLTGKLLALGLLGVVAFSVTSPAHAGDLSDLLNWWIGLVTKKPVSVPEPATLALFATGVAAVGLLRRRRKSD